MPHSGGEARPKRRPLWQLALKAVVDGGPGTCHFAVTSICNARCEFCNFAVDRMPAGSRHSVTLDDANRATEILSRNGVQFLIFTGGEPLAHRDFIAMVRHASGLGITTTLVTNGSLLTPDRIGALAMRGLRRCTSRSMPLRRKRTSAIAGCPASATAFATPTRTSSGLELRRRHRSP